MNIRESKEVPVEILEKGFSLTHLGVLEYAWRKDDVEKILQILERRRVPILGGNVYKIEGGNISSTFDSWYINNDGNKDFSRSGNVAWYGNFYGDSVDCFIMMRLFLT